MTLEYDTWNVLNEMSFCLECIRRVFSGELDHLTGKEVRELLLKEHDQHKYRQLCREGDS